MHLLRQAEEILGEDIWELAEDIEGISVEYWSLRKLRMDGAKYKDSIQEADTLLNSSHEERNIVLTQTNKECQALEAKRAEYIHDSVQLVLQRDRTIAEAKHIKRKFEAAQTKKQVITLEGGDEEIIEAERQKIKSYKLDFKKLKMVRDDIGAKMKFTDDKIMHVEETLGDDRKRLRDEASSAYQTIGRANRDISKLAADMGVIRGEMQVHFCEIGRYVSHHVGIDPICTQICKDHADLVAQMQSLRSSIALNHKLASMANV